MINFQLSNSRIKAFFRLGLGSVGWWEQNAFVLPTYDVKVHIFLKFFQYIIYWDKTKFFLQTINVTKNTFFFLLRAPTHHNFTFNLFILYELKHKVHQFSKDLCGIFHFWFHPVFTKVFIFVQQKVWTLLL